MRQAAARCGIHRNTSCRWRHRFLALPESQKPAQWSGIAEADETFFRRSLKGQKRGRPRAARKRGSQAAKRATSTEYLPVLIARDRTGATIDPVLPALDSHTLAQARRPILAPDTVLCADGAAAYRLLAQRDGIALKAINLSAGIRVVEGVFPIQNVNAYDRRLAA